LGCSVVETACVHAIAYHRQRLRAHERATVMNPHAKSLLSSLQLSRVPSRLSCSPPPPPVAAVSDTDLPAGALIASIFVLILVLAVFIILVINVVMAF
jgi:hypothetical protein